MAAVDTGERDGANEEGLAAGGQWTVDRRVEKYWLVDSKMWSVCETELLRVGKNRNIFALSYWCRQGCSEKTLASC